MLSCSFCSRVNSICTTFHFYFYFLLFLFGLKSLVACILYSVNAKYQEISNPSASKNKRKQAKVISYYMVSCFHLLLLENL